jgi:hypothetical protein
MNIVCIKHGDKYSAEYVNKLYSMVKRYAPSEFIFYCLTEDPEGLSPEISIMQFPKDNPLEKWWNKMWAFQWMIDGDTVLFDLDVIIHGDLNDLFVYDNKLPSLLRSYWKKPEYCFEVGNTPYNSSVMKWKGDSAQHIAERFFKDPEYYMLKYKGVDRFLWNEKIEVGTLPITIAYSYINSGSTMRIEYPICIFNETEIKQHQLSDKWISQYWI